MSATHSSTTLYGRILTILEEEGPLSTWGITRRLDVNGTGQTLFRLRALEGRGKVERISGTQPGWSLWRRT